MRKNSPPYRLFFGAIYVRLWHFGTTIIFVDQIYWLISWNSFRLEYLFKVRSHDTIIFHFKIDFQQESQKPIKYYYLCWESGTSTGSYSHWIVIVLQRHRKYDILNNHISKFNSASHQLRGEVETEERITVLKWKSWHDRMMTPVFFAGNHEAPSLTRNRSRHI